MSPYPYPLRDWREADGYPAPEDRDGTGWAWEFLRRNPEYQRLWALFDSLPDSIEWEGREFSDTKHGKWRGTPWADFRFLTGGACWYANPEPIPGEHVTEYEARCPEGQIMPFADYLRDRFRLWPWPIAPAEELSEHHGFQDPDDSAPWLLDLSRPPAELVGMFPETYASARDERIDKVAANRALVPLVFDLRQPPEKQLDFAREILREAFEDEWRHGWGSAPIQKKSGTHFRPLDHAQHIRLLDAAAVDATLEEMAAILHPREPNGYAQGYRVTKRLRRDLKRAEQLRDSEYWRLPSWRFRLEPV